MCQSVTRFECGEKGELVGGNFIYPDTVSAAADADPASSGMEIDGPDFVLALMHRPDRGYGPDRAEQPDRRIELQNQIWILGDVHLVQCGDVDWQPVLGPAGFEYGPLQPRQVRHVWHALCRLELLEELRQRGAVFGKTWAGRGVGGYEAVGRVGEKPFVDDTADDREVGLERLGQRQAKIVAMDL